MKTTVIALMVLVGISLCGAVAVTAQHQPRSISSNGRGNNKVKSEPHQEEEEEDGGGGGDDSDSAFDNTPISESDSSEITFPVYDYYSHLTPNNTQAHQQVVKPVVSSKRSNGNGGDSRWKTIPLNALVKFGTESNLANFFKTYVKNTKIVKDNDTYEEYLADSQGKVIYDDKNEKVIIGMRANEIPTFRLSNVNYPFPVKGRSGGAAETVAKTNMEIAMTRSAFKNTPPPKSQISLPVCSPELTTVPVPLETLKVDPSMLVIPKCLKIERCGGCCLSDLTVCEPELTEKVKHTVTLLGYDGDSEGDRPQLQFVNTSTVEVERHKSCKCKCRTKPEHCRSRFHKYEANQCSCVCTNIEAHQRCVDNPENRFWDNDLCQCSCQDVKQCSSGYIFDLNTCDCRAEFESRMMKASAINRTRKG